MASSDQAPPPSEGYQTLAAEGKDIALLPLLPPRPLVPWTTGLYDCCITCWCPGITFGQVAEIVDKGNSSCGTTGALYVLIMALTGFPCVYSCFYRSKLRQQYSLEESPCGDCCVHFFCEYCALCQEYRELNNRGFNVKHGWYGNVEERNNHERDTIPVAPTVEEGMTRN